VGQIELGFRPGTKIADYRAALKIAFPGSPAVQAAQDGLTRLGVTP
jgi:hypothetical protein